MGFISEMKFGRDSSATGGNSAPGWRASELVVLYGGYPTSLFEKINA